MTQNILISWPFILLYLMMGGGISFGYYFLLLKSLKMMKRVQKKGLFLFLSSLIRLILFIVISLLLTQCHAGKFLWYILGFMITRLFVIHHLKKES